MYVLPHVTVRIVNDLLQFTDMLNFEATETPENCIINFLVHFSYDFPLTQVSKRRACALDCTALRCTVLHTPVTKQPKLKCVSKKMLCNRMRDDNISDV